MHRSSHTPAALVLFVLVRSVLLFSPRRRGVGRDERGDVPGWVLITVMTAGLVAGLWAIAGPALEGMLRQALDSVR